MCPSNILLLVFINQIYLSCTLKSDEQTKENKLNHNRFLESSFAKFLTTYANFHEFYYDYMLLLGISATASSMNTQTFFFDGIKS